MEALAWDLGQIQLPDLGLRVGVVRIQHPWLDRQLHGAGLLHLWRARATPHPAVKESCI